MPVDAANGRGGGTDPDAGEGAGTDSDRDPLTTASQPPRLSTAPVTFSSRAGCGAGAWPGQAPLEDRPSGVGGADHREIGRGVESRSFSPPDPIGWRETSRKVHHRNNDWRRIDDRKQETRHVLGDSRSSWPLASSPPAAAIPRRVRSGHDRQGERTANKALDQANKQLDQANKQLDRANQNAQDQLGDQASRSWITRACSRRSMTPQKQLDDLQKQVNDAMNGQ